MLYFRVLNETLQVFLVPLDFFFCFIYVNHANLDLLVPIDLIGFGEIIVKWPVR